MMRKLRLFLALIIALSVCITFAACKTGDEDEEYEIVTIINMPQIFKQSADRGDRGGQKRDWDKVSSYFINYGGFQNEMLNYDVAIVDGGKMTESNLDAFQDAGVWTVAKISVGEEAELKTVDKMGPGGLASYYMYNQGGIPEKNEATNSYYVNAGSSVWQSIVIREAGELLDAGYDGILIERVETVVMYPETLNGMCALIKKLSETYPDAKIVMSNGFTVLPTVAEYIDAVMFEYFYSYNHTMYNEFKLYDDDKFVFNQNIAVNTINALRQEIYFPVFAMDCFEDIESAFMLRHIYNVAWEYDFIPYIPLGGSSMRGDVTSHKLIPTTERGAKALLKINVPTPVINGDVSEANLAYAGNGGRITVDSTYAGYKGPSILNDGIVGDSDNIDIVDWSEVCWASAENEEDHWIEISIQKPAAVTSVVIDWALDGSEFFSSQKVTIEALIGGVWTEIGRDHNIAEGTARTTVALDCPQEVTRVRIYQKAGDGPFSRSNLMWVSEVSLYAE